MRFGILGPLEVLADDGEPLSPGSPKQRTLLALLLLADNRPIPAERLIDELWGTDPPATGTATLQVHLSGLRKILGNRLQRTPAGYVLHVKEGELDATEFIRLTTSAGQEPGEVVARLGEGLGLWRGEVLGGAGEAASVVGARERLGELRLEALERRVEAELALGRHRALVSELTALVAAHPLRERLSGQLMLALHQSGRTADANGIYVRFETACRDELGTEPSDRLRALAEGIRRNDPTLDAPGPAALPVPASRFVGRRRELDRIEELLGTCRLLTLTGPGGTGKTRLALQLARDLGTAHYPDGIHLIELAGSSDEASVTGRLAAAVGARELPGEPLATTIAVHLQHARALVVLDNCEHVVDAVAELADYLLNHCGSLRLLVTSREPIAVTGETVVPVGGLELPRADASYEEATRSEAIRLLAARGATARAGFRITPDTYRSAVAVCRQLDGLPLAIELAAARLRMLNLTELEQRLERPLDLLTADNRSLPRRHRALRSTLEWSHDLLDKPERALFARLAVFVDGFPLEAAEYIGTGLDDAPPVLDLVSRLVHRSLLVPDLDGPVTRYRMLETIHEYAVERLAAAGDADSVAELHGKWWQQWVETAPQFGGDDHAFWLARLTSELGNLRAAMDWALDGQAEQALAIATRSWWFWWTTGQMNEGSQWLQRALAVAEPGARAVRGEALRAAAALARNSGDLETARKLGLEALAVQQELGDRRGLAMVWNNLCMTATGQRDLDAALEYAEHSRQEAELVGAERGLAIAANNTATVLRCLGRLDEAAAGFSEALELFSGCEDRRGEAAAVGNLGVIAARQGRVEKAREYYLRSLKLYQELQLEEGELDMVEAWAGLEAADNPEEALRLLRIADRERRRLGAPLFVPDEIDARAEALTTARSALTAPEGGGPVGDEGESLADVVVGLLSGGRFRRS
ncbi:putative ATPase [Kribbella amoyensis]|uniref:Putative ATPase n=1 Tax=Kribbella amoyensis TaxID=996641 RepID=A0A561BTD2_9ACTN|nr:BTAD domain-containing putative transcriptional regulator [Kribbella amoyensis]TWD82072.1 putative ATPase [Kribbella amoyensis]